VGDTRQGTDGEGLLSSDQRPLTTALATEALLGDGRVVRVRALRAEDADAVRALHAHVSEDSRRMRFFSASPHVADQYAQHLTTATDHHLALVAENGTGLLGVASAEPDPHDRQSAEMALLVDDSHKHTGIGTPLLEHLASAARHRGIHRFVTEVLDENVPMLEVLRRGRRNCSRTWACFHQVSEIGANED
jgi:GNAT superfamily N-acetyltransferase